MHISTITSELGYAPCFRGFCMQSPNIIIACCCCTSTTGNGFLQRNAHQQVYGHVRSQHQACSILLLTLKKCIFFSRVQFTNMKDILGIVFGHKSIYIGRQGMNLTLIQFYRQYTLGGIHILENVALLFPELHTHCLNRYQVPHDLKFCVLKLEDDLNFWLGCLEVIEI